MLPTLQVGPLAVQVPGLILILGLWMGLTLAEKHSQRMGVSPNHLYNLVFISLIAGVIGARLMYAVRYPDIFAGSLFSLFSLSPSLLDPLAGVFTGLLAAAVYAQRKALNLWSVLDAVTPILATLGVAISLANLASGNGFGYPTNLPWGIQLWGAKRHPTQIYEAIAAGFILWVMWPSRGFVWQWLNNIDHSPGSEEHSTAPIPGTIFLAFIALSALARLFLEAFRGDSVVWNGGWRAAQVIAWGVLALSLIILRRMLKEAVKINGNSESTIEAV